MSGCINNFSRRTAINQVGFLIVNYASLNGFFFFFLPTPILLLKYYIYSIKFFRRVLENNNNKKKKTTDNFVRKYIISK